MIHCKFNIFNVLKFNELRLFERNIQKVLTFSDSKTLKILNSLIIFSDSKTFDQMSLKKIENSLIIFNVIPHSFKITIIKIQ